jgi:hypothetical protein
MNNMEYYVVMFSNEYAKKNGKFAGVDIEEKFDWYLFEDEKPFPMELFKQLKPKVDRTKPYKVLADIQMCYVPCWRLISEKFYFLLERYSKNSFAKYYPCSIYDNNKVVKYYFMHFSKSMDVFDEERSKIKPLHPVIFKDKLNETNLFWCKDIGTREFCVSEVLKSMMEKEGISGCSYQKIT